MSHPTNPLTTPLPWDLVAGDYAADVVPMFAPFAEAALDLLGPLAGTSVLDVASGPGTFALKAAPLAERVTALDFSPGMIARLEKEARARGVTNVTGLVGDGQALPFPDASFAAGASLFGLMFFPDRARGFAELRRVLEPGGRAVVSSWVPIDEVPHLDVMLDALRAALRARAPASTPDTPPPRPALLTPDEYHAEMGAAGFGDIEVVRVEGSKHVTSTAELWADFQRTMAPLVLMKRQLGAAWEPVAEAIGRRLEERFGSGPQTMIAPAWLGVGRA